MADGCSIIGSPPASARQTETEHLQSLHRAPSCQYPSNRFKTGVATQVIQPHLSHQTAAEPPSPRGTHRIPGPGPLEAVVYIFHSSSYSSNTGSNRSSSQSPGRRIQTEPAGKQIHVSVCEGKKYKQKKKEITKQMALTQSYLCPPA